MSVQVLGISGSPIPQSNTDRCVQMICRATGLEWKFIKLSELSMEPCRACLGCMASNQCVVRDDAHTLAELFREVPVFVIGAYTPYSSLDARTKTFMERMYCHRHRTGLNAGKIGASVITTACPPGNPDLPPAATTAGNQIAFWMMEEGMNHVGSMVVLGNVPCIRCGHGDTCELSGIKMLHGPEASVASVGVHQLETDEQQLAAAEDLGRQLRAAFDARDAANA